MARCRQSHILDALTSLLPRRRIRELGRRLGVVRRRRKLDVVALVYSLVLGFSAGDRRSLTGLRRAYLRATGVRLAPSSFHARFSAALVQLMQMLALEALQRLNGIRPKLHGVLAPFVEVLAIDTALLRLHNALQPHYPSVYTHYMKASAKLAVVMNVVGRGLKTVALTHGSRHDVHLLEAGAWMRRRLLIFDLGFYRAPLFMQIESHGGYFLSRMKKQGNPVIVQSHERAHRHLVGTKLCDAQKQVRDDIIDVDAEMTYQLRHGHRPYVTTHRVCFRCVAVYNPQLAQWHRYVTNLPTAALKASHFTAVYAARWEVELLFRELKGPYRIEHMPSANRHVCEALIYAALITLLLSRKLYRAVHSRRRTLWHRIPLDRWAVLFASIAQDLLALVLRRHQRPWRTRCIHRFLTVEATDPNKARLPLPRRAEIGVHQWP